MNNLSLHNRKDPRFQQILRIADDINTKAETQSRRLGINPEQKESAPYFRRKIKYQLDQLDALDLY